MPSKKSFKIIKGRLPTSAFQVSFGAKCTDPDGIGKFLSRYLIPILFEVSEYSELNQLPLSPAETREFRKHLLSCIACAEKVFNVREAAELSKQNEARSARKADIKSRLKLITDEE